jgi:arsenical pump membrane protein
VRPFRVNVAWWAAGGAILLVLTGALPIAHAYAALGRGLDVYLFLIGMMGLSAFADREGVFTWTAARVLAAADASRARLLALVYGVGIVTTAFLSNDATIVVLTPAVLDAVRRTDADPLPFLVACALIANAASFILPIANPSNLVFYSHGMPPLGTWLGSFGAASIASIALTYGVLVLLFRRSLRGRLNVTPREVVMPRRAALLVLAAAAAALVVTSSRSGPLGIVACASALVAVAVAGTRDRRAPQQIAHAIAWPVVVLTAGLFVLVRALEDAGAGTLASNVLVAAEHSGGIAGPVVVAFATAIASNLVNNLPVGLDVGNVVNTIHPSGTLASAALVGVNVGPNFSTNGSLATVLWLAILHRSGVAISPLRFALIGVCVTPLALTAAALLAR